MRSGNDSQGNVCEGEGETRRVAELACNNDTTLLRALLWWTTRHLLPLQLLKTCLTHENQ